MKKEITKATGEQITPDKLKEFLKFTGVAKNLTNDETGQFIEIAQAFNLNPFKREIHVSKYGNDFSIVVGYEVYIKRAEATGLLAGWSVKTEGKPDFSNVENSDLKAIVTIHRKDRDHPFVWEADFADFAKTTREGRVTQFWKKARFMIKKVAIGQAFRLCFNECSGLPYTEFEGETSMYEMAEEMKEAAEISTKAAEVIEKHGNFNDAGIEIAVEILEEEADMEEKRKAADAERLRNAELNLKNCDTRDEINEIWKQNRELQSNSEFVLMVKKAGERLPKEKVS